EQSDLDHAYWTDSYLTYKNQVVGICAPQKSAAELKRLHKWIGSEHDVLKFFAAATSVKMFTQRSTTLSEVDILTLPCPEDGDLDCSANERVLVEDVGNYYGEFVRVGEESQIMRQPANGALSGFSALFSRQLNSIYKNTSIRALEAHYWPGLVCQPFVFGDGNLDWSGSEQLRGRLDVLLCEKQNTNLHVTRIARVYDGPFVFILKPDRLRYWLKSIALRDADETLSDLRAQGFCLRMLANAATSRPCVGTLSKAIQKPATFRHELMDLIVQELPVWRDRADRRKETAEAPLTSQVCAHLNSACRRLDGWDILQFRVEEADEQGRGRRIDLVASPAACSILIEGRGYVDFDTLMPIECKRLPTPKENGRDEREYVVSEKT